MASEWVEKAIGDIADVIGGSTPSTRDPANFDGDVPWLTPKDLAGPHPRYVSRGERNLSRKGLESCSAQLLPPNSVLLSSRAPIGYVAIAANPIATNQGFRSLVVKPDYDHEFVYYWLLANVEELERHATGSTFKEIPGSALKQIRIRLPRDRAEQRAIASILGTLDDKIELNRRMNETLEAMARAIFKSWFVDFLPVRAKMEGRWKRGQSLPGLPADTWELWPSSFQPSPLGPIPKGWKVSPLGDVCEFAYGKALKGEARRLGAVPVYGSNGQVGWHDQWSVKGPGIVIGRKGNPGTVLWVPVDFYPIDTTFYVVPRTLINSMYYLFHALSCLGLPSLGADSAVPGLNRNIAYMTEVLVPSDNVLKAFDRAVLPMFTCVYENNQQSRTLAALRDALLPKLISGEIRVLHSRQATEVTL